MGQSGRGQTMSSTQTQMRRSILSFNIVLTDSTLLAKLSICAPLYPIMAWSLNTSKSSSYANGVIS